MVFSFKVARHSYPTYLDSNVRYSIRSLILLNTIALVLSQCWTVSGERNLWNLRFKRRSLTTHDDHVECPIDVIIMREISVSEAKRDFTSILKRIQEGEAAIITKRGKPVGAMIDFQEYQKLRKLGAYNAVLKLSQELVDCGITATELYEQSRRELEEKA